MKPAEKQHVVHNNLTSSESFSIKATGKAFRILSDGLYSDKILAVVRELSCNAYDSHIAAGKQDVPIRITLPSRLNPTFTVTDEGIGLSHDEVTHLYTTYFESTKTDSNDFIGALGLGSKSPFSYVDTFNIQAIQDGRVGYYVAYIDDNGVPNISMMGEEETDEQNGVAVSIAVKQGDITTFNEKTSSACEHFKPYPKVNGAPHYEPEEKEYVYSGDGWGAKEYSYGDESVVVQGVVGYPLDVSSMGLDSVESVKYELLEKLNFKIDFDIGQIEVSASRESISYTKYTVENVKKRFDEVLIEFDELVTDSIKNTTTLWEANIEYNNIVRSLNYQPNIQWEGNNLSRVLKISMLDLDTLKKHVDISLNDNYSSNKALYNIYSDYKLNFGRNNTVVNVMKRDVSKRVSSKRIYDYFNMQGGDYSTNYHNFVISPKEKCSDAKLDECITKFLDLLGNPITSNDLLLVSDAIEATKAQNNGSYGVTPSVVQWTGHTYSSTNYNSKTWSGVTLTEEEFEEGGYYIPVIRYSIYKDVDKDDVYYGNFDQLLAHSRNLYILYKSDVVYGVRKKDHDKFKEADQWVNIFDIVKTKLDVVINDDDIYRNYLESEIIDKAGKYIASCMGSTVGRYSYQNTDKLKHRIDIFNNRIDIFNKSTLLQSTEFYGTMVEIDNLVKNQSSIMNTVRDLNDIMGGNKLDPSKYNGTLTYDDNYLEEIINKYKLLHVFEFSSSVYVEFSSSQEEALHKMLTLIEA